MSLLTTVSGRWQQFPMPIPLPSLRLATGSVRLLELITTNADTLMTIRSLPTLIKSQFHCQCWGNVKHDHHQRMLRYRLYIRCRQQVRLLIPQEDAKCSDSMNYQIALIVSRRKSF
jgi:hypothetical protein